MGSSDFSLCPPGSLSEGCPIGIGVVVVGYCIVGNETDLTEGGNVGGDNEGVCGDRSIWPVAPNGCGAGFNGYGVGRRVGFKGCRVGLGVEKTVGRGVGAGVGLWLGGFVDSLMLSIPKTSLIIR